MYQTMEEIREQYDGQWVYLIRCREGEYHETLGGVVAIASRQMAEASKGLARVFEDEGVTHLKYVGNPPEEVRYVL